MQLKNPKTKILCIFFTKTNILCTITNFKGKILSTISIGFYKTKGLKKITTTTMFSLIKMLFKRLNDDKTIYLKVKGVSKYKNEFIKLLKVVGFNILLIQENLLIPHGGCKNKKTRKI